MYRSSSIYQSLINLKSDFLGFSFNISGILSKISGFFLIFLLFILIYFIGRIVERKIFGVAKNQKLGFFINFALGYIFISTLIFILGLFSILTTTNVVLVLFVSLCIGIIEYIKHPAPVLVFDKNFFKFDVLKYISFLIILAAFLRMLTPQTAGDPLEYHLDYPRVYLYNHTVMIQALGDESYTTVPQLPEMLFIPSQIFTNGEMSRAINFGFFVLIFCLLYTIPLIHKKHQKIGPLAAIFFGLTPISFKTASYAFSDFPALFCLILLFYLFQEEKYQMKKIMLTGILMGGALASKIWVLAYFPFYLFFLFLFGKDWLGRIKLITIFCISALVVVGLWYIRGIMLVGNPFYVNTNQGQISDSNPFIYQVINQLQISYYMSKFVFNLESVMTFAALMSIIIYWRKIVREYSTSSVKLVGILAISGLILPFEFGSGRYSLPYMIPLYMIAAYGWNEIYKRSIGKVVIVSLFSILVLYYCVNTLIILPYGLGWANADNFLRRNLLMTYAAYYDFNHSFIHSIKQNEVVATYGLAEMYYATFRYKNIYYFFNQQTHILKIPTAKINKLLIRGGNFQWFCSNIKIKNCDNYKVALLTSDLEAKQYLYTITER